MVFMTAMAICSSGSGCETEYLYVWKDQLTAYNGQAITYDGMGNPLSYRGMTMTWEKGRQLKQVVKGGKTISYTYDNNGVRISKTADGVKTSYYLSGDRIIALKKGNEVIQFAYDEKENQVSMLAGGKRYYYLYNAQGDVIGLLDSAGAQVVTYKYNSWGKPLNVSDSTAEKVGSKNPFRYRGYCLDDETGLYYVSSRYYDPEIGRFINADSVGVLNIEQGSTQQYNLYAYCLDNPVNRVDVGGNLSVGVISAVIGGAIGAAMNDENVLKGALGGLVTGVIGSFGGTIIKGAVYGALGDFAVQVFTEKEIDVRSIVISAAIGAAGGVLGKSFKKLADFEGDDSAKRIITHVGDYYGGIVTGSVGDLGVRKIAEKKQPKKKKLQKNLQKKQFVQVRYTGYYNRYGGPTRVIPLA